MKRILALILAAAMMLALFAGCGGTTEPSAETASAPVEESAAVPAEEPVEEAPAEEPASVEVPEEVVESATVAVEYPLCEAGEVELEAYMAMAGFKQRLSSMTIFPFARLIHRPWQAPAQAPQPTQRSEIKNLKTSHPFLFSLLYHGETKKENADYLWNYDWLL